MGSVCIDCRYIGPRPSGIAEVSQALADFVPELAPDLDFVLLRHPLRKEPLSNAENVREVIVPHSSNGPATMWWLPHVVDFSGIDLFHATSNILPAGLQIPTITTIHDVMWLTHPEWCNNRLFGHIERAFYAHGIKRALGKSAAIATISEASRREILTLAHDMAPDIKKRVFVTRSGVSPQFRPVPVDRAILAKMGIPDGKRFVLTVGQYAPYKNHEGAVRAFAKAFPDEDDVDLVLVQRQGKNARGLLQLATQLGLAGRLHLLQSIGRGELVQLYSAAAALLHPSLCEGFGNPLAEAMACGCPVITSNLSAMPEVTAGAARLIDPRDASSGAAALRSVVGDAVESKRMRQAGIARAAELDWRDFAAANLAIYRKVLADS